MPKYELIDHTADLAAFFYGADPKEVFENAGLALMELMVDRLPEQGGEKTDINLAGADFEELLVHWLNELLYWFQVHLKLTTAIEVQELSATKIIAAVSLADFDLNQHGIKCEIKAATYHQIEFREIEKDWRARVVFDL
ncbi:MAG: archease [Pseudomonadota bacterium]